MKILKNKTKIFTMTLVLTLTISTLIFSLPIVNAEEIPTYAFLAVSPNPVGVNQDVTIIMWLSQIEPTANADVGGRWENYTVLITKPDGTKQTLGPFTADAASFAYAIYTADQIGTYTLEFSFPGQHVQGSSIFGLPIDSYYGASSFTETLTVQEEAVTATPQTPLPNEYWTRPINSQNFDWYTISGNWFGTGRTDFSSNYNVSGNFNPYTTAPNTGHIVWTKPLIYGGLIGGEFGGTPTSHYYSGKTYEPVFLPPVVINGVLYYNSPELHQDTLSPITPTQGFYAVDLRTGETLWHQNNATYLSCGQVYNCITPNQEGGIPYLWSMSGSTWQMYDAVTGNLILQIANATSGTIAEGPNGELLVYVLDTTNNWLAMWNSSLCIQQNMPLSLFVSLWMWKTNYGSNIDWQLGVQWNVTIDAYPGESIYSIGSGVILATTGSSLSAQNWQMEIGYNMTTGEQLWVQNRTTPYGQTAFGLMGSIGNGIYTEFDKGTMQLYGYSLYTGEKVWGPSEPYTNAWGSLPTGEMAAYGISYDFKIDGLHAFNITTGEKLWDFYADPAGLDFPGYSTLPFENNMLYTIADGKVFASTGDSHGVPQYRGARLYAVDAFSGEQVWSISGYYQTTMPVADGYLVAHNAYDNQLYCFSKGPSKTTVSGPTTTVPLGEKVLITGTVIDISPGTEQLEQSKRFPNGVPAMSDESMSEWMEYVYMQQPCPEEAEGVEVVITTLDPNGNTYELGRTISSDKGTFGCEVDLPVPGLYKIIVTFEGSDSYYASSAEKYVSVEEPLSPAQPIEPEPSEPEPTEPEPAEPAEAPLITTEIAIAAAIIVAVAVIVGFWIIKKRK